MKHGPIVGAGAMISLAASWAALVMAPQLQLGALAPTPLPNTGELYPAARPGLAAQGADLYRSLGCAQCHTRAVRQENILFGVRLNDVGNNASTINLEAANSGRTNLVNLDLLLALARARPDLAVAPVTVPPAAAAADTNITAKLKQFDKDFALLKRTDDKLGITRPATGASVNELAATRPADVLVKVGPEAAERVAKLLGDAGGKAELVIYNLGPDIERGWGARRSVAQDYVNDSPALLGSMRVGPDLASLGTRAPDKYAAPWKAATTNVAAEVEAHLLAHLFNPRQFAKESVCPSAKFLFDTKKADAPAPKHEARALVAYLMNSRVDIGLPEAPVPAVAAPAPAPAAPAKP